MKAIYLALPLLLAGCATTYTPPVAGSKTADVTVQFQSLSNRAPFLAGVFEDGRRCRGFQVINVNGKLIPSYQLKVKADEPVTLVFSGTAPEIVGLTYTKCGGTYTFEPASGKQYFIVYRDEPERCGARLGELVNGTLIDRSKYLMRRDAKEAMPGIDRCNDEYKSPRTTKE